MSPELLGERLALALLDTITMVGVSAGIPLLAGIPLAVLLVLTTSGGILPWPRFNRVAGAIVNAFRATPNIQAAANVEPADALDHRQHHRPVGGGDPLSISATPFLARIAM